MIRAPYTTVEKYRLSDLRDEVNRMYHAGWRPIGGVAVDNPVGGGNQSQFIQAMILEKQEAKP